MKTKIKRRLEDLRDLDAGKDTLRMYADGKGGADVTLYVVFEVMRVAAAVAREAPEGEKQKFLRSLADSAEASVKELRRYLKEDAVI